VFSDVQRKTLRRLLVKCLAFSYETFARMA
jgi:hypothetical protein